MRARLWYRGVVAAAAAAGLVLSMAACSSDDPQDGGGTINWWHIQPADGDLGQVWTAMANEFNGQNPDAFVRVTPIQNDPFKSAIATAMQAGDPPDLFQSWGGSGLRTQVEAGQVRDLTDDLSDVIERISPGALAPYTIDGRVYGVPFNSGMVGFWYNTELFEQAGITSEPETWSEFLEVVQHLQDAGITPIALGNRSLWPGHFWWSYLAIRIAGLDAMVAAAENNAFDHPGFVEAGERLQELLALEPFQEGYLAVDYEEPDGQAATMGNGEAAMELMGHWSPGAQIDQAGLDAAAAEHVVATRGFFPFPAVEGGAGAVTEIFGGGDGFAVGANAPDATIDFVRYIFDNFDRVMDTPGNVPVLAEAADQVSNPNMVAVLETLAEGTGFQLYLDQDFPEAVGATVNESVGALFAGQMTPQQVVDSINEVWAREG
jgi:raffinose/stachyose/melibiose transport system substrate-binding protein